jgi:succinyl-CoA synthetase alpha subunit
MSILIHENTTIIVQGISGAQAAYHARLINEYNPGSVVGGVSPGRGGMKVSGIPVYDTIAALKSEKAVDATMIMAPPRYVLDAAWEAIENQIPLIVMITQGVPVHDTLKIRAAAKEKGLTLLGPNTMGIITPGVTKIGVMPDRLFSPGKVGLLSLLGTLNYEAAWNLTYRGIGQSSSLAIGGDRLTGITMVDAMELYRSDENTEALVILGETPYLDVPGICRYLEENPYSKPLYCLLAGRIAIQKYGLKMFTQMGLGGPYLFSPERASIQLEHCGVIVVESVAELVETLGAGC